MEDRLKLTAGIKFLDNTYSHGNFLPNARLLWTPDAKQSFRASATRSIRLPSRFERDGNQLIRDGAEFIRLISNPHLLVETLWGFDTGYRRQITSDLSIPLGQETESGGDPKHQFTLRTQLDLRLAWKPKPNMELSLVGQNLLQSHHQEFAPELIPTMPVQIQRSVFDVHA